MSTFVLVHGATLGAWTWYKIIPLLERRGHTVIARDLPGHGRDRTLVATVTLQAYVESVCATIDAQREPVVLVGHSMGGGVITQVAEYRAERIRALVYLAALLPQNGQTLLDCFTLKENEQSLSTTTYEQSADGSYVTPREELTRECYCADCSDEDWALLKLLLIPEATAPTMTPVATSDAKFGRVRKVYIECVRDRLITLALQRRLAEIGGCKVLSLDTSHCPIFSAPQALAAHLDSI